ncbi:MAG: four helix bundle protein [Puniceicoccaceae bacterium]
MRSKFSHEKLEVYQLSLTFVVNVEIVLRQLPKTMPLRDQLDRASISIPLNIAEGTGKYTARDKCRFYDIAKGSAMECAACLDIVKARNVIDSESATSLKAGLYEIVAMLIGLIRSISKTREY